MVERRISRRKVAAPKARRLKVGDIIQVLDRLAPESTAESWDNVGLLAGDPAWKTSSAVVSVDLTAEAIAAAKKSGSRLIVNHHPCIFPKSRGLSRFTPSSLVFQAAQEGIAVYSAHTNFDRCALDVPRRIAAALGARIVGRMIEQPHEALKKLVVFVPESHVDAVHAALGGASAGHVGNYDSCAFLSAGQGRFRGSDSTKPFLGTPGRLELASEIRLETVFPAGMEPVVLRALREAHPYEEIAYDIYSVEQRASTEGLTPGLGYGFYGDLEKPAGVREFVRKVGKAFEASGAILTPGEGFSSSRTKIRRIGYTPGKGSSFVSAAAAVGCDLFITGEVGYHDALSAARKGMSVLELGHRESERFFLHVMTDWLRGMGLKTQELNIPVQTIGSF
jgi:dinuclear metal center YbgI/SA1388 family protein